MVQRLIVPEDKRPKPPQNPMHSPPSKEAPSGAFGSIVRILTWIAVIFGVGIGVLILLGGMTTAQSAPQEAVVVALALASAILPYCFARAISEISREK